MGDLNRFLAASALSALAACGHAANNQSAPSQALTAEVGRPAPNWSGPALGGQDIALSSLRGKGVYLNFFATWCHGCNEEAAALETLSRQYRERGLEVVGIDVLESPTKAADFRRQHHLTYPLVVDEGSLRRQYRINALPVQVFIDRAGTVHRIVLGQISLADMQRNVESILR
jgi:peroxiredoxin